MKIQPVQVADISFESIPPELSLYLTCLDRMYIKSLWMWIKMHEFVLGEAGVMHLAYTVSLCLLALSYSWYMPQLGLKKKKLNIV